MLLYDPERHEKLIDDRWDEGRALSAIERIVADTHRSFDDARLWPVHPFDRSRERPPDSLKPIYYGAAGVIWALNYLREAGATTLERDYLPTVRELIPRYHDDIRKYDDVRKYMGGERWSYLLGETGILLLEWKLAPSEDLAHRLDTAIEEKIGDMRGLAWGAAGAMVVALYLHERTGVPRWKDLFLRSFEALCDRWEYAAQLGCHLWTHDLYGVSEKRLGGIHGFAANVFPLIRGNHLLSPDRRDEILRRIHETVHATALKDGGYANWPNNVGPTTRENPMPLVVQHCNGASGVINCLAEFPEDPRWPIDELLQAGGELIWAAGPPIKFPSLCHGAAGSGYAFLKLYRRTRDDKWLDHARRFAMHGIVQADRWLRKYGQHKFSLWTGDLGLAIFLRDCIDGSGNFPTLDVF